MRSTLRCFAVLAVLAIPVLGWFRTAHAEVDKAVLEAEAKRVAVVEKVRGAVVAVFAAGGQGGGSGVIIDEEGYALTNFHVVAPTGPVMQAGLADGVLYDAVLVGLDKVGDVALIKLLPKEKGKKFPFAKMGDSDKVKAGDWSLAMGNPFLLATDFTPTVTFGLVSGVHRYQYPEGKQGLLEYTDCIQIDTSINPGNSGGPLFNMDAELIGINGRGSFDKRTRINSGVGYAISINQIKNFLGELRAGLDTDHATLGGTVAARSEDGGLGRVVVSGILESSDAHRRGMRSGDQIISFAGRPVDSINQFKNVLGIYPKDWRVPISFYDESKNRKDTLVRLQKLRQEEKDQPKPPPGGRRPPPAPKGPAAELYIAKKGFANYYFNKLERDKLWKEFTAHGDFSKLLGDWEINTESEIRKTKAETTLSIKDEFDDRDVAGKPITREWTYHLRPERVLDLPEVSTEKQEQAGLRPAVRKAVELMKKYALTLPQQVWDDKVKEAVGKQRKDLETVRAELTKAVEDLRAAEKERNEKDKDAFVTDIHWRARYDYALARTLAFLAYVNEYDAMLAQVEKDPPALDRKIHRGWRMEPQDELQSGAENKKLATEAKTIWTAMQREYKGSDLLQLASKSWPDKLGLKLKPTGATKTIVRQGDRYLLDPLKIGQELEVLSEPPTSGGFMMALYNYKRLLTLGADGFEGDFYHGGIQPCYPPVSGKKLADCRVLANVLVTEHAAVTCKWYFSLSDSKLIGFETYLSDMADPCEVYLSDYRKVDGRELPHKLEVYCGGNLYGTFTVKANGYKLSAQ